jgi:hypothetical protein
VDSIDIVDRVEEPGDAVIVMECGDVERTGIQGLAGGFVINIDRVGGGAAELVGQTILSVVLVACGEVSRPAWPLRSGRPSYVG